MFIHSDGTAAVFTWVKIGGRMVGGLMIVYTAGAVTMPENNAIGGYFYTEATNTSVERLLNFALPV